MATAQRKRAPGPWVWTDQGGYYDLLAGDGSVVHTDGSACGEYGRDVDAPDGPNARLIAAAPDLYAALKVFLEARATGSANHLKLAETAARSAIAKADGDAA